MRSRMATAAVVGSFSAAAMPADGEVASDRESSSTTFGDPIVVTALRKVERVRGVSLGKNTNHGAILLNTRRPSDNCKGYGGARYGNDNDRYLEVALNVSIMDRIEISVPAYTLFNARAGLANIVGSNLNVAGRVRNLTDKTYKIGSKGATVFGFADNVYGEPRTYGI